MDEIYKSHAFNCRLRFTTLQQLFGKFYEKLWKNDRCFILRVSRKGAKSQRNRAGNSYLDP